MSIRARLQFSILSKFARILKREPFQFKNTIESVQYVDQLYLEACPGFTHTYKLLCKLLVTVSVYKQNGIHLAFAEALNAE